MEIARRIPSLAGALLAEKGYAAPVDLLQRLGWLKPQDYENWRFRRVPYLERVVTGSLSRLTFAMGEFRRWARARGLRPSWTHYRSWGSPHRVTLRFSRNGVPAIEEAYATHWLPPKASTRSDPPGDQTGRRTQTGTAGT